MKAVRNFLDDYLENERSREPGPLFQTRTGKRFSIQQVDYLLKKLAGLANATLPAKEHIDVHPHILRHTMLRKVREEKGIEYAIEYAGHASEKNIRRYTMPSEQRTESAREELFGKRHRYPRLEDVKNTIAPNMTNTNDGGSGTTGACQIPLSPNCPPVGPNL